MNLESIIKLGRKFAAARHKVSRIVDAIRVRQQAAVDVHRANLRAAVNLANELQSELADLIAADPALWEKPRTINVDGIRLGLTTKKGTIVFDDPEKTVDAIKRKYPGQIGTAIHTKETPNKETLLNWSDEDLARIGCRRTPDDPCAIVIKPTDSEVDKLVNALLEKVEPSLTANLPA